MIFLYLLGLRRWRRNARHARLFLWALWALSFPACMRLDPQIFMPITTEEYYLPENRIPIEHLEEVSIDAVTAQLGGMWATREAPRAAPTILFFESETGNLDFHWKKVMNLWDAGFNVLAVDYRGYGKSTGQPHEAGLYLDAESSLAFLEARDDLDPARIVIWGFSLGAAVAADLGVASPRAALVLEAPFTSQDDLIRLASPYDIPGAWITDAELNTRQKVGGVTCPVLVAHGTADLAVPFWMGEEVFTAAPEPKRFVAVPDGRHSNLLKKAKQEIFATLLGLAPELEPVAP